MTLSDKAVDIRPAAIPIFSVAGKKVRAEVLVSMTSDLVIQLLPVDSSDRLSLDNWRDVLGDILERHLRIVGAEGDYVEELGSFVVRKKRFFAEVADSDGAVAANIRNAAMAMVRAVEGEDA